jgi:hypothetical protein
MSYRSLGSDEVTLRNYRPVGRRKGNMFDTLKELGYYAISGVAYSGTGGRSSGAAGSVTGGNGRFREHPGGT